MFQVIVNIHDETNLYHASKALAGLYGLAAQGQASVQLTRKGFAPPHPAVLQLEVADQDNLGAGRRRIAIDLLDRGDLFDHGALSSCDVYFKRSYFEPELPTSLVEREKIRPWGLNFPCRQAGGAARHWLLLARGFLAGGARAAWRGPQALHRWTLSARQFACLPAASQFEASTDEPLEPVVVYQTRLWEQHETEPDDAAAINRQRVQIVRALRRTLGRAFLGGLVATPLARREYPDEVVSPAESRMANYAARSRRAAIGVYTRGLHHSSAFKLAEYLAGGKAIVAEGLRNQTPAALEPDEHWLAFRDADECVQQCRQLLQDQERRTALRRAAAEYYRRYVEPMAHLRWTLDEAFRQSSQGVWFPSHARALEVV